jgi:high affinity sulfate transporter 1
MGTEIKQEGKGLKQYFPIATWLPAYDRSWLRLDIIAALTVWALLVPEAMAYASLAGVPPEYGLYAAPLALVGYAIFGSSRQLVVGPSSTVAIMSAATVALLATPGTDEFIQLTILLALITGVVAIVLGIFRAGVIADFMSKPVLHGFVVGLALTIAVGQLDKLLGYSIDDGNFFQEIWYIIRDLGETHWLTLTVGVISLALLFLMHRFIPKVPAALTVVFLSIAAVSILNLDEEGVHIIGEIPAGLPSFGLPDGITFTDVTALLGGAIGIVIVGFSEGVAAAKEYANKHKYEIDPNQELIGLGAANIGSGLFSGFVVDGSLSKSAAADDAGGKTQMSSLINAVLILITIVALTSLFHNLAEATLGAIVIHAVWGLIEFSTFKEYLRIRKLDFWAAFVAMMGVLIVGILEGLILAVLLSIIGVLSRTSNPRYAVLGKVPDRNTYLNTRFHSGLETSPGLLIFRFDEALFFANASKFRDEVRGLVAAAEEPVTVVIVDAEAITDIDYTALKMLEQLQSELSGDGVELWFSRINVPVKSLMERIGLADKIGSDNFHLSVNAGAEAFLEREKEKTH